MSEDSEVRGLYPGIDSFLLDALEQDIREIEQRLVVSRLHNVISVRIEYTLTAYFDSNDKCQIIFSELFPPGRYCRYYLAIASLCAVAPRPSTCP